MTWHCIGVSDLGQRRATNGVEGAFQRIRPSLQAFRYPGFSWRVSAGLALWRVARRLVKFTALCVGGLTAHFSLDHCIYLGHILYITAWGEAAAAIYNIRRHVIFYVFKHLLYSPCLVPLCVSLCSSSYIGEAVPLRLVHSLVSFVFQGCRLPITPILYFVFPK